MSVHGEPVPMQPIDATKLPTSFVAQTSEVESMRKELAKGNPVFWYELAQNAADYNDNTKGRPAIVCTLSAGSSMSLTEYIRRGGNGPLQRVEFRNKIKNGNGMTPDDVAHIAHGGGESTLGVHGRGLTVTSTLAVADKLCSSIEYSSKDPHGAWTGRGTMETTRADQKDPHFVLEYKRNGFEADETVVRVVDPAETLTKTLVQLPTHFLPTNDQYFFARFAGLEKALPIGNLVTVAEKQGIVPDTFTEDELREMRLPSQTDTNEPRRVEILPDELVQRNPQDSVIDYMYVDGLRLRYEPHSQTGNPALVWSFYGFGKTGEYKRHYRVARSKDSSTVEGSGPTNLMGMALKKCVEPEVHARILQANIGSSHCLEGYISYNNFEKDVSPHVQQAIAKGWDSVLRNLHLEEDTLITSNESMIERARNGGRNAVLLRSPAYVQALKSFAGVQTVEDAFQVTKPAEYSGEVVHMSRREPAEHIHLAVKDSLDMIVHHRGSLAIDEKGVVKIQLGQVGTLAHAQTFSDLSRSRLISAAMNMVGANARCRVSIDNGEHTIFFELRKGRNWRNESIDELSVYSGQEASSGGGATLEIIPNSPEDETVLQYHQQLQGLIEEYSTDGVFDTKKYLASVRDEADSLEGLLEERRAELARLEQEAKERRRALSKLSRKKMESEVDDIEGESAREIIASLPQEVGRRVLKTWIKPDATYDRGIKTFLPRTLYFLEGDTDKREMNKWNVSSNKRKAEMSMAMKEIKTGLHPLLCPLGYRPLGYQADGNATVSFYESKTGKGWAIEVAGDAAKNVRIYYDRELYGVRVEPSEKETQEIVDRRSLSFEWNTILNEVRNDPDLNPQQKLAIVAKAWVRTFTYVGFVNYGEDTAKEINIAKGNCVNNATGFAALARAVDIPSREVGGVTGNMGRIVNFPGHAWNQVYLDGKWLDFEPQEGEFITRGQKLRGVPEKYRKLIKMLPESKFNFAQVKELLQHGAPVAIAGIPVVGTAVYLGGSFLREAARYISTTPMVASAGNVLSEQASTSLLSEIANRPEVVPAAAIAAAAGAIFAGRRVYRAGTDAGRSEGRITERQLVEAEIQRIIKEENENRQSQTEQEE